MKRRFNCALIGQRHAPIHVNGDYETEVCWSANQSQRWNPISVPMNVLERLHLAPYNFSSFLRIKLPPVVGLVLVYRLQKTNWSSISNNYSNLNSSVIFWDYTLSRRFSPARFIGPEEILNLKILWRRFCRRSLKQKHAQTFFCYVTVFFASWV